MATNVGDPFLLAAYAPPHNLSSYAGGPSKLANVYASHHSGLSAEGHVLAAAQGDGVHILDLSTLHPIVSHTLGPSTVFSCPPVSRIKTEGESSQSAVYAAMENIQGISPNERGRTVRVWIDNASGEPSSSSVKQREYSAVLPHRVSSIVANDELPDNLLFVGDDGQVTVTDNEVNVQHAYSPADPNTRLIRSFAFGRRSCSFMPHRSPFKQGVVLVMLIKVGSEVHLAVLGAGPSAVTVIGDCLVPLADSDIVDVSCSQSGFVSILTRSGEWHTYHIDSPDHTTLSLSNPSSPLTLKNLTSLSNPSTNTSPHEISILSLGSSHVLLAGITTTASPELALLLWDLQYGVLLSSKTLPVPSSLNRTDKTHGIDVKLAIASTPTTQQALLVLGAKTPTTLANTNGSSGGKSAGDASQRSSVLVVPYSAPATSTVANALGRAAAGEKWLATTPSSTAGKSSSPASSSPHANLDPEQTKCISAMRTAMEQKRVEAADEAFFAWVAKVDAAKVDAAARVKVPYGYEFVRGVLGVVLDVNSPASLRQQNQQSEKNLKTPKKLKKVGGSAQVPYSSKVVRYLLEKRCVSSSMVKGGLLPALRVHNDWSSMIQALKTVNDIPEDHLVAFLSATIPTPRQREKLPLTDEQAMDVDPVPPTSLPPTSNITSSTPPPPLPTVLALCITYPTSAPALRLAIRTHLNDASALTSMLQVLVEWVRGYVEEEKRFLPEGVKRDAHGALVPVDEERKEKRKVPGLQKILLFTQTLLDASFLTLLTHAPSHATLNHLLSLLQPETELTDALDQLRGPLEPFVKAHRKMVYEAAHGPEKPEASGNGGADWRKKRKEVQERVGAAVGVYQVEELVL